MNSVEIWYLVVPVGGVCVRESSFLKLTNKIIDCPELQDFSETAEPGPLILCNYRTNLESSLVQANERVLGGG